jgi:DNA polymerase-3 subunit gamma/tau
MGYQVIARKYRPQNFRDLVGQQHVTRTLTNAVLHDRLAHAYIFSGARGVGKTTTARILAKVLNCKQRNEAEPCGQCDSCREIAASNALDVIEIDAASNRGIDQIRELREMVQFAPLGGRYKVVLLDEAHMLTPEASNALLKTLEEPPDRVLFILATTEPENLSDTIRSRSQHFHFRPLEFHEVTAALKVIADKEKITVDDGALAVMARAGEGSLRDSLSILEQAIAYCGTSISDAQAREILGVVREEVLDELMEAIRAQSAERVLALIHALLAEGQNLQAFCREAIRHIRNLLVARVCGPESTLIAAPTDERPRLKTQSQQFSEEDLTRYFEILLETEYAVRKQPDPRLHLELGLLRLVNAARLAPLEELLAELGGESLRPRADGARASAAPAPRTSAPAGRPELAAGRGATPSAEHAAATNQIPGKLPALQAPSMVARAAGEISGLEAAQVEAIKAAVTAESKMLANLVQLATRWVKDGAELQLYFSARDRVQTEMVPRDYMEKLRAIMSRVIGQDLRVCVKLDPAAGAAASVNAPRRTAGALRQQVEQDPVVREMLRRFGGHIRDVKDRGEE